MITVYFDGLCEPVNPGGIAAYSFAAYRDGGLQPAILGAGYRGDKVTNNVAELTALIRALEWLVANGYAGGKLVVKGDSRLVIRQLQGRYAVRSAHRPPLQEGCRGNACDARPG
ncbi:MAG: RNase H family protein [Thermofilum sp.]